MNALLGTASGLSLQLPFGRQYARHAYTQRHAIMCASNLMYIWPTLVKSAAGLTQESYESKVCKLQQPI